MEQKTATQGVPLLEIKNISKTYEKDGSLFPVLDQVSFTMEQGEFFVLLGRSGCGKTTLLRCIGGFLQPEEGTILRNGKIVTGPDANGMMVFQDFNQLFPWMTLKKNLIYAMKKALPQMEASQREEKALHYIKIAGLEGCENQYPSALSGGMKQRGALARALCLSPQILLMDEPFSSLDYLSRDKARQTVKEMAQETGCGVFLVTHDIEDALELADRIGILDVNTHSISKIFKNTGECSREEFIRQLKESCKE